MSRSTKRLLPLWLALIASPTFAAQYTGAINLLEVWKSGNIAFSLVPAVPTCNSQFILNVGDQGTKNQYAALLAAKTRGAHISVYAGDTCIAATSYGGSYNEALYIYVLD